MSTVLGIDLGLSGARAAIVDGRGRLLGRGRSETPRRQSHRTRPDQLPKAWLAAAISAARQVLADTGRRRIDAIGIGAFGPCPILLDQKHRPIMAAAMFTFNAQSEKYRRRLLSRYKIPPHRLGPDNTIPQLLWWQRQFPEVFARAALVVDAAGFLSASLTGQPVIDPITMNDYQCPGLDAPLTVPQILPADSIAGGLTAAMAGMLGLPAGTPVTVGTYDSHVDIAGTGTLRAGQAAILLGSTMVLGAIVAERFKSASALRRGLRMTPHVGRGYFLGGWTSSSGALIDWASDLFGTSSQSSPPNGEEMIVLPYFAGERVPVWDPLARGVILGATLATTRSDIQRAMIEGIALSTFDISQRLYQASSRKKVFRATGGGLRNSHWAQATSDALGCSLEAVADAGDAIGPAALAMRAIGQSQEPRISHIFEPDERKHDRLREKFRIYSRLYPALRQSMHELGRLAEMETVPA